MSQPLGPYWLPPRIEPRKRVMPPTGRMCGRCRQTPAAGDSSFCEACRRHWGQIYDAGGFWDQDRAYQAVRVREVRLFTMTLIVARAKLERAQRQLEAAILAGEAALWREWKYEAFGRAWSKLERLREQIRDYKRELAEGRSALKPLP